MNERPGRVDGVIDEALRDLTCGAPREGLRTRVLARVASPAGPAPGGPFGLSWRAHPVRRAAVVALAGLAVAGALVAPRLFRVGQERPSQAAAVANPPAVSARAAALPPPPAAAVTPSIAANPSPRADRPLVPASDETATPALTGTDEDVDSGDALRIVPLPDPSPIADRPIEIAPMVIPPVLNREIQIPLIETARPQTGPGQTDKR